MHSMTVVRCSQAGAHLLRFYRATRYTASGIDIRIGRRSAALDSLLAEHGVRDAVLITAWNPRSGRQPKGWNKRMQRGLCQRLRRVSALPGMGVLGQWQEAHLLVFAPLRWVLRLARRYRQNAVVAVARRHPARLIMLRYAVPAPPQSLVGAGRSTEQAQMTGLIVRLTSPAIPPATITL